MAIREALAREALSKDPKSEAAHLALANILLQQQKRAEAKSVVDQGLALNGDNLALKGLKEAINTPPPALHDKEAQTAALLAQLQGLKQILGSTTQNTDLESMKAAAEQRRTALDKKYGISNYDFPADLRPPLSERRRLIMDLRMRGDKDRLLEEIKNEFEANSNSIDARLEYVEALSQVNRDSDALKLVEEAIKVSPAHPFLMILKDGISAKLSATSTELKQSKSIELLTNMMDARTIKSEKILKGMIRK
jgi:tetratricopeptide (TPR) repeat protein